MNNLRALRPAGQALPTDLSTTQTTGVQLYVQAQIAAVNQTNATQVAALNKTKMYWQIGTAGAGVVAVLAIVYAAMK